MSTSTENNHYSGVASGIFWLVWILVLVLIPFYGFTLIVEIDTVTANKPSSTYSPIIGGLVLIVQILILVFAVKAYKQRQPLSKLYLILLGGSVLNMFVWAGGCALMGPLNLH